MKKVILVLLILCMGCLIHANVVEFFESIPQFVRYAVGTVISVYAVSWAYSWFFDPIIVVADTTYGAYTFGPVIVVSPDIYYHEQETVLNHEYVHYVQHAIYGPILSLTYPICCWYSTFKTGNQWDANYWELQAIELSDCSKHDWEPSFVIELE